MSAPLDPETKAGLEALEEAENILTLVGTVFTVSFRNKDTNRLMTPPADLVRTRYLLMEWAEAVSVEIPKTGVYQVTCHYRSAVPLQQGGGETP